MYALSVTRRSPSTVALSTVVSPSTFRLRVTWASLSTVKSLSISTLLLKVALVPLPVITVDVPDLTTRSPEELVNAPYCVPPSFKTTSAPFASRMMSLSASKVIVDDAEISAVAVMLTS